MTTTSIRQDLLTLLGALAAFVPPPAQGAPPRDVAAVRESSGAGAGGAARPATPPIACTLEPGERRERAAAIRRDLLARVSSVDELPNGYVLWFDRVDGELGRIASFVELESRCCPFLDFAIRLDSRGDRGGRIALHLEGPPGTKDFLAPLVERARTANE